MYLLVPAVIFLLVLGALIDIITRQDGQIKHLPKMVWILIVILLPLIGSILWFAVGREYAAPVDRGSFGDPRRREALSARRMEPPRGPAERSTEEELAAIDREIEFHEDQARIRRMEAELDDRRTQSE